MVEVLIEEMFGSDRNRPKDYGRAVVIDARPKKTTNEDTLRSERRSALTKRLTEPTLLEMSGNPTSMIGLCQEGQSSPGALRRSAGVNSFRFVSASCWPLGLGSSRWRTRLPFAGAALRAAQKIEFVFSCQSRN